MPSQSQHLQKSQRIMELKDLESQVETSLQALVDANKKVTLLQD